MIFLQRNTDQLAAVERPDKNYFIVLTPKSTTIADSAIASLESKELGK